MKVFRFSSARTITLSRGGKWYGRYGTVPCPICQPEGRPDQNALTLTDCGPVVLAHCKKGGCSFKEIMAALGVGFHTRRLPTMVANALVVAERHNHIQKRRSQVLRLWHTAKPINDTPAETYLRRRGITCALPATLRYHPAAWHMSGRRLPALVARVEGSDGFGVHRTYLRQDGNGKADVEPKKAMLGQVKGGAVRLARARGPLVVAEGIETALSLACGILSHPTMIWAALSTAGLAGLVLPSTPSSLTIATDGDDAGRKAGSALAERATALGWKVSFLPAPDGQDWNDVLRMKGGVA